MKLSEKQHIVQTVGLNPEQTEEWFAKYRQHKDRAVARGMGSELTFSNYLTKVVEASLNQPSQISIRKGDHVLGRRGDVGPYTVESSRFITVEQNYRERQENGRTEEGHRRHAEAITGLTKENCDWRRRAAEASSETLKGRTKETHAYIAENAAKKEKAFVLTDPQGVQHHGKNVKDFCIANGLNVFPVYDVLNGKRPHHKGWTGYYV